MEQKKKVFLLTNGCPENRIDTARIKEILKKNNYTPVDDHKKADCILFNACGLTIEMEQMSIQLIEELSANKKSDSRLLVYGCLPKINKTCLEKGKTYEISTAGDSDLLKKFFNIANDSAMFDANYLIPQTIKKRSPTFLRRWGNRLFILKLIKYFYNPWSRAGATITGPNTFYIKISTGCINRCSFCAVKFSRGNLVSKSPERVFEEFERGLKRGFKEFALIGTEIGAYGRDINTTIIDLLQEMIKKEGDFKIKLRNLHPGLLIAMFPEFINIFESQKISYLSTSVESGNNRILRLMKRGHNIEDFKKCIEYINNHFPALILNTQIMIGFPGETEKEFNDTIKLLDDVKFNFVEVYTYQTRLGTEAAAMKDQISKTTAKRRFGKIFLRSMIREYHILW